MDELNLRPDSRGIGNTTGDVRGVLSKNKRFKITLNLLNFFYFTFNYDNL